MPRILRRLRYFALALVAVVLAGLVVVNSYVQRHTREIYQQRGAVAANVERIRFYDEALTDSARLSAATGERAPETRYLRLAPELDRTIADTIRLVDSARGEAAINQTAAANQALVGMEMRAFHLARLGQRRAAYRLVTSPAYRAQKARYETGYRRAQQIFSATLKQRKTSVDRLGILALILGILGGAAVMIAAVFYMRLGNERERVAAENERRERDEAGRRAEDVAYHESQSAFTETMQVTRAEGEAHTIVKRHLERNLPGCQVVVLNRNNSDNRLLSTTPLPEGSPLIRRLAGAEPESCLAVRLGRTYERGGDLDPLLECELCGTTEGSSTCVPSLVGGEVIGSVLIAHPESLSAHDRRRVNESVTQAAPVLANLRSLTLAETRAATDALTGLANKRAIEDTMKRMAAQAGRSSSPLSAILCDLDHFKQVNDVYGHEKGDEALAAVGQAITSTLRTSDFAGRYGGEEFLVLLPDTGRAGAIEAAEKLRKAIATTEIAGIPKATTASCGVATLPDDAGDTGELLRRADRALYAAKAAGRDRVEAISRGDSAKSVPQQHEGRPKAPLVSM